MLDHFSDSQVRVPIQTSTSERKGLYKSID